MSDPVLPVLQTVRDWLRFAVTRFEQAGLVYGHGTANAVDEAAFLILTALHLPIDRLDPWLDARLTMPERTRIAELIEARVVTRKPASYLTRTAWIASHRFYVDERVIVPRSFLAELLVDGLTGALADDAAPRRILDLCTGSGCLAIIAAHMFSDADVVATDASSDALAVAARNVADHRLKDRITLVEGDLFGAVAGQRFDLILTNPPYVTSAAVAAFPPEYQAEPPMAHDGGRDGMMLVRRILADASAYMNAEAVLVCEIGQGRTVIERDHPHLPFLWLDTQESEGEVFALRHSDLSAAKPARPKARARK